MNLKIYIFRHGQTYYNKEGKFTGLIDSKLTPLGVKQAKIIGKKLKGKKIQVAFQTHLSRSRDTLKEVIKYHPECKKVIVDDRMIERNYGDLNGTTHSAFIKNIGKKIYNFEVHGDMMTSLDAKGRKEFEKVMGKQEYNLIHRGFNVPPPGGESFAMVERRVKSFIKYLIKYMKKNKVNIMISAHGNSIRLFRKIMEKASVEETVSWNIPYDKYFEYTVK